MVSYEIRITRSAEKELGSLSKIVVSLIWDKIRTLATEPRPKQSKKLRDIERAYRLRIRDYRVIYTVDDEQKLVVVTAIRHRKEVYR